MDALKDFSLPKIDGILGTIENSALFLQQKSVEFKNALVVTVDNMGNIIENLNEIDLSLYGHISYSSDCLTPDFFLVFNQNRECVISKKFNR